MITGFNTDIDYNGVTYHVQTEDKGMDTPLILSLVYAGGTILASKRTPYTDLIESGFDVGTLTERLQRQHKLICAAIHAGRLNDLISLSERGSNARHAQAVEQVAIITPPDMTPPEARPPIKSNTQPEEVRPQALNKSEPRGKKVKVATAPLPPLEIPEPLPPATLQSATPPSSATLPNTAPIVDLNEPLDLDLLILEEDKDAEGGEIYLNLMDDGVFRAGNLAMIRVFVGWGSDGTRPISDAAITVKILGTTFRPMVLSTVSDKDGMAVVRALLPRFSEGRAAVLIRAVVEGREAELRRVIHQS
ncbi:MAG: hypothetical protein H0W76_03395 [Pyrinomonadaceae bacterium]|nr:hypothetical protein [Pyrinomonadaceae bacterium]